RLAHAHNHTCIVANPGDKEMQDMISKAHINILPSYSSTGIKLKLLNALFNGRYCLVNNATVEGSELDSLCLKAGNAETFKKMITELHVQSFTSDNIEQRKALLRS